LNIASSLRRKFTKLVAQWCQCHRHATNFVEYFREGSEFSVVSLQPVAHAAYARLKTRQRTPKGWHPDVDHLITPRGFGTTLKNLGGGPL
jgi:hypothetical protein